MRMPNWQLFHMYKHLASWDPEAKAMMSSDAAVEIARSKMLTWPRPSQGGMRLSGDLFDSLMTQSIREKLEVALSIEHHHLGHSHLDIVDVRHFLLRKVSAEMIGLTMALYGSAAGRVELPNAAALWTMQYCILLDADSVLPLAEIHKSKHGDPCECHLVFNLDPRMPGCLIESFFGMVNPTLTPYEIGVFRNSFSHLPVGSRFTMSEDGSWSVTDTRTDAVIAADDSGVSGPQLGRCTQLGPAWAQTPDDLDAAWAMYIAEVKSTFAR